MIAITQHVYMPCAGHHTGCDSLTVPVYFADLLERMLGFQVSLQQLITWFPKPHNQSLEVHPELQTMLRNRGIPNWPPNADKLPQCLSYKLSQRALKKRKRSETGDRP